MPGFNGLGPAPGADLLLDLDGSGGIDEKDVVVTPLCAGNPCADGSGLGLLTDMRVTFKLGDDLFNAELPFDIGLDGFPLRLAGTSSPAAGGASSSTSASARTTARTSSPRASRARRRMRPT